MAASCAIPGFFTPVPVGGRLYVDGGLHSPSNLDLLAGRRLDVLVALNPMGGTPRRGRGALGRFTAAMRRRSARLFAAEAAAVARWGADVLRLEPTDRGLAEIGDDVMDAGRAARVAEVALATTTEELRRLGARPLLRKLAHILG